MLNRREKLCEGLQNVVYKKFTEENEVKQMLVEDVLDSVVYVHGKKGGYENFEYKYRLQCINQTYDNVLKKMLTKYLKAQDIYDAMVIYYLDLLDRM